MTSRPLRAAALAASLLAALARAAHAQGVQPETTVLRGHFTNLFTAAQATPKTADFVCDSMVNVTRVVIGSAKGGVDQNVLLRGMRRAPADPRTDRDGRAARFQNARDAATAEIIRIVYAERPDETTMVLAVKDACL